MYPGIELRLLRYVVAVADELHFTRAAIRLHVAQPSLSRQIKELEAELGTALFERDKRHVRLTPAGAAFVKEARQALMFSQRAKEAALAAIRPWSLGYSPYINYDLLKRARSALGSSVGKPPWRLVSAFTLQQLEMIRLGHLDAGLVTRPVAGDDLQIEPVLAEPLLVALPSRDRRVQSRRLRLSDLNGLPWVGTPTAMHPLLHEHIAATCAAAGLELHRGQSVTTFAEGMAMVAAGGGFCFVRACYEPFRCSGVVFKPLQGDPLVIETALAALREQHSKELLTLFRHLGSRAAQSAKPAETVAA